MSLGQEPGVKLMDSSYLFSGTHVQLPFLGSPGHPSKDETAHSSHPISISKRENVPHRHGQRSILLQSAQPGKPRLVGGVGGWRWGWWCQD